MNSDSSQQDQYDAATSKGYTDLVETDPVKQFVQYPSALRLLGDMAQKTILDVGCGSGLFTRELAHKGAEVTGYDLSPEQIARAQATERSDPLHIDYTVSNPIDFKTEKKFDKAVAVLVLHYAPDTTYLKEFFSSTKKVLKNEGEFVSILMNPEFKRLGEVHYNRKYARLPNGKMHADFFDKEQTVSFSVEYSDFSKADYEHAALNGGFARVEWFPLKPEQAGVDKLGEKYWEGFEEDSPFIGFVTYS